MWKWLTKSVLRFGTWMHFQIGEHPNNLIKDNLLYGNDNYSYRLAHEAMMIRVAWVNKMENDPNLFMTWARRYHLARMNMLQLLGPVKGQAFVNQIEGNLSPEKMKEMREFVKLVQDKSSTFKERLVLIEDVGEALLGMMKGNEWAVTRKLR